MNPKTAVIILLGISFCTASGQSSDEPNRGPVQAELLKPLHVRHLSNGATVFARVTLDWVGEGCVLRQGSILQSTVVVADQRKGRGTSKLALSFTKAQCNGDDMQPLNLVLAAVADAPIDWKTVPDSQFRMPLSFSNPHPSGMLAGIGSAAPGDLYTTHVEMMGVLHRFPMRPNVKPGDVLDIKGMKLDIGTGPDRSSVISTKDRDVSLGAFTQLLLVPASLAFEGPRVPLSPSGPMPEAEPAGASHAAVSPAPPPADTLEVCAPPGCVVDLPTTASELEGHSTASIAIHALGYTARSNKILEDFEDEETLVWLGSGQLLFAFNPHALVHRGETSRGTARIVRAVLLDAQNRKAIRAVDWEITDTRRYLWQLGGDRVLAHIGNELRVYSAGLKVEQRIPLTGPLAFVRIAPNGELIAIATLNERHSHELHSRLREDLGSEPEEDIHVEILDKGFKKIAEATTISGLQAPTLLNEGQAKLLAQPEMRYRIALSTWDNKNATLARFRSSCTPELSSIAPDLLFLVSCDVRGGETEYRAVRSDGKLLLEGSATSRALGHEATGNGRVFAVKVVQALRDIPSGIQFKASDLDSEEIRIYSAVDGKRLSAVRVNEPVASRGAYALSPDGSQLAVVSGQEIKFFSVPAD